MKIFSAIQRTKTQQDQENAGVRAAKQPVTPEDALLKEFSEVLDKIAVQLSTMSEAPVAGMLVPQAPGTTKITSKKAHNGKRQPEDTENKDGTQPGAHAEESHFAEAKKDQDASETDKSKTPEKTEPKQGKAQDVREVKDSKGVREVKDSKESKEAKQTAQAVETKETKGTETLTQVNEPAPAQGAADVQPAEAQPLPENVSTPVQAPVAPPAAGIKTEKTVEETAVAQADGKAATQEQALTPGQTAPEPSVNEASAENAAPQIKAKASDTPQQPARPAAEQVMPEISTPSEAVQNVDAAPAPAADNNLTAKLLQAIKDKLTNDQAQQTEVKTAALFIQAAAKSVLENPLKETLGAPQVMKSLLESSILKTSASQSMQQIQVNAAPGIAKQPSVSAKSETALKAKPLPASQAARSFEKVESALKEVVKSKDGKTINVRLDPPSLGKVQVGVTMKDGVLHARIIADSPEVNQMLREKGHDLQATLRKLGLNVDRVNVSVGFEHGQADGKDTAGKNQDAKQQYSRVIAADEETTAQSDFLKAEANPGKSVYDHWVA